MKEIILVKNGEIALKGLNRGFFEDDLVRNIKWRIKNLGKFDIKKAQSTIYITPMDDNIDLDIVCDYVSKVFGIATFSRALTTKKDLDIIIKDSIEYLKEVLPCAKTFKVCAKRSDKTFPYKSPDLQREVGGALLEAYPSLKVDVHNPEITVTVEIRDMNGAPGGLFTTAVATVTLLDVNDNPPTFTQSIVSYFLSRRPRVKRHRTGLWMWSHLTLGCNQFKQGITSYRQVFICETR